MSRLYFARGGVRRLFVAGFVRIRCESLQGIRILTIPLLPRIQLSFQFMDGEYDHISVHQPFRELRSLRAPEA